MTTPFYVPPEQLVKDRAEFARKGIGRGRAIVATQYDNGILLVAENPSTTLHKVAEIYDRIAFAGVGRYNEFESLRVAGIRHADLKGYLYGRADVQAKALANAFAQTLGNIFTHDVKPFEVEVLVAELGEDEAGDRLYRVSYDGTLIEERRFAAIGGPADELAAALAEGFEEGRTLDGALAFSKSVFGQIIDRDVDSWEAAVLERSDARRAFRRL
jgi:proteasome alpha subunit